MVLVRLVRVGEEQLGIAYQRGEIGEDEDMYLHIRWTYKMESKRKHGAVFPRGGLTRRSHLGSMPSCWGRISIMAAIMTCWRREARKRSF